MKSRVTPASWALRRIPAYREEGFEALIDERTPREPKVSVACRQVVQGARQANAQVTKEQVLEILAKQKIAPLPSDSTLKREFARVDGQRRYAQKKAKAVKEVVELPLAGGELLLAAEGRTLAELYDQRWPVQENAFKKGTTLALDEHRGNCGRMVANVAVIIELERLAARTQRDEHALEELTSQEATLTDSAALASQQDLRARKKLATMRRQLDALIEQGQTQGKSFAQAAVAHQQALVLAEQTATAALAARQASAKNQEATGKLEQRLRSR